MPECNEGERSDSVLVVVSEELKQKIRSAGGNKLNQAQLAVYLNLPDQDCRMLFFKNPELNRLLRQGELDIVVEQMERLKRIARNDEDRNQFAATKLLYEIYSDRQSTPSTLVVNQTINNSNVDRNLKLLESLDTDTIEAIVND
jgi:hypothetical protein